MDITQDVLLPILLAAIIANTAVIAVVLVMGRKRSRRAAATATSGTALETSILSTSDADAPPPLTVMSKETDLVPDQLASPPDLDASAALEASGIDPLTGLIDAVAFARLVAAEDARMARYHRPATVVICELDGLERLIDRLGPDAGDRVVPALADTIKRNARGADHVARLGSGRFGILLPETDEVAAINYVERVRGACELWLEAGAIAMRLAIGWAGTTGDPSLADTLRLATDRMHTELRRAARRTEATPVMGTVRTVRDDELAS
jgi:diguanylate cyclase (GGDEF)-like protein